MSTLLGTPYLHPTYTLHTPHVHPAYTPCTLCLYPRSLIGKMLLKGSMVAANLKNFSYQGEDLLRFFFRAQEEKMKYNHYRLRWTKDDFERSYNQTHNLIRATEYFARLENLNEVCVSFSPYVHRTYTTYTPCTHPCTPHIHPMYTPCTP